MLLTILFYQNCADTAFLSQRGGHASFASSNSILKVENEMEDTSNFQIIQVRAHTSHLKDVQTLFWDHIFEDDVEFCEQTSAEQNHLVTFLCPRKGKIQIFLTVTLRSGEVYSEKLDLNLDSVIDPGEPNPEDPLPITPQQLYQTYCMGCHGNLANSTKRGITLNRLNNGINGVSQMNFLRNELDNSERQAIVDLLNQ